MAESIGLTISVDISEATKRLALLPADIDKGLGRAIKKSAFLIERYAKQLSPVDTGRLRNSISSDVYPMEATIEPHVNYAIYVHEGTRHFDPRPFMRNAGEQAREQIEDFIYNELKAVVE